MAAADPTAVALAAEEKPSPAPGAANPHTGRLLFPALVFAAACLLYAGTAWFDYAWDDKLVITANEYTTRGVKALPDIFTRRVSVPFKSEYRPVTQALFAVEFELFGLDPAAGHVFSVLWYALTSVGVYSLVRFAFPRFDRRYPLLVALLFVVHPLHVEVVANIKGRDEILALCFGLGAVILLVEALERRRWSLLAAGAACFLLAILAKSNAVTLLPLVILVAWYRSPELIPSRRLALAATAIAVVSAAVVVLIRLSHTTVSADLPLHLDSTVLNNVFLWTTRPEAVTPTALVLIARYLGLFLVPHPLIHLYGYDQVPLSGWRDPGPWLVVAGLAVVALTLAKGWKGKPPLLFGVVWFAVSYSVYSNLIFLAPDTMADRYLFIPSIGLSIIAVQGVFRLAGLHPEAPRLGSRRARAVMALLPLALAGYFARSVVGSLDWRNDSTLIHNRIRYLGNNAAAQAIYGHTLNRESLTLATSELRQERKAEAMGAFTRAVAIYPDFQPAWISIGRLFAEQGIYDKAELAFLRAQRLSPLNPDVYFNMGALYLTLHDTELAIPYLEKAILLDRELEEAYVLLGRAYLQDQSLENLGAMTATARRWFPENADLDALFATYLFRMGRHGEAFALAREVVAASPDNILALTVLSSPLAQERPGE